MNCWKKLPGDIQNIIMDAAQEVEDDLINFLIKHEREYIDFIEQQGVKIYSLSSSEANQLIDTATKKMCTIGYHHGCNKRLGAAIIKRIIEICGKQEVKGLTSP